MASLMVGVVAKGEGSYVNDSTVSGGYTSVGWLIRLLNSLAHNREPMCGLSNLLVITGSCLVSVWSYRRRFFLSKYSNVVG